MKKTSKNKKQMGFISILIIAIIVAITTSIIKNNNQIANEGYSTAPTNADSEIIANYIKKGITIGGVTGKLESLNTFDATATAEDILYGKTAYVKGKKITGMWIPSEENFDEITFSFEDLEMKQNIKGYEGYIPQIVEGNILVEISDENKIVANAYNDAEGEYQISLLEDIKYNKPGTHKYYVRQTNEDANGWEYDHNTYEIIVQVIINNGKLEANIISDDIIFTNIYSVNPTIVTIGGVVYSESNIALNNFEFELKNTEGKVISRVSADENGMIKFEEIKFELPGTYNYTISQIDTKINNIVYDLNVKNVTITVIDNSMGSLEANINNTFIFENKINENIEGES